jgi:hypothetical protein
MRRPSPRWAAVPEKIVIIIIIIIARRDRSYVGL